MNVIALGLAVLALVGFILASRLDRLVKNRLLGGLLQIAGIAVVLVAAFGIAPDTRTSGLVGSYLVYLGIPAGAVYWLFFRKKRKVI